MASSRSSRNRYKGFVEDYRKRRLDEESDARGKHAVAPAETHDDDEPKDKKKKKRRKYVREYLSWLKPHRYAVAFLYALALIGAGMEMVEPLFMRFIVDKVLLNKLIDDATRFSRLNLIGLTFLILVVANNLIGAYRNYQQRLLNTKVML